MAVLILTVGIYLAIAMTSSYNLGVRHLMPILPFLYLPAALWAARSRTRAALLTGALAIEALALAPLWMSATNTWWLGPANPTRWALAGSDTEYHQNFITLAGAARERQIERLYVLYPLLDERELRAYIPQARLVRPETSIASGEWVAVNVNVEQYLPAIPEADPKTVRGYRALQALERDLGAHLAASRQGRGSWLCRRQLSPLPHGVRRPLTTACCGSIEPLVEVSRPP